MEVKVFPVPQAMISLPRLFVLKPSITRDDVALLEVIAIRSSNERIYARLGDHRILIVKLALNGSKGIWIVFEGCYEINTNIFATLF